MLSTLSILLHDLWRRDHHPTPGDLLWRASFEAARRTGWLALRHPSGAPPHMPDMRGATHSGWLDTLGREHWLHHLHGRVTDRRARRVLASGEDALLNATARTHLAQRAERAARGIIRAYSARDLDFGTPLDWHRAPSITQPAHWPRVHASCVGHTRQAPLADIKDTWELGRQPHVFDWLRLRAMRGERTDAAAWLADQLLTFEAQNPWRQGVHWASGQECAIRLLVWCVGVAALGGDAGFTPEDFQRFLRLVWLHATHIAEQLDFARHATPNNHLIAEAVALGAAGCLFDDWMPEASSWRQTATTTMRSPRVRDQFLADGGYIHASATYQRHALDLLLFAARLCTPEVVSPHWIRGVCHRSGVYLARMQAPNGRLPNLGANDGALLAPWTACAYEDMRPLLTTLRYHAHGHRAFARGEWDEALFWLAGEDALAAPVTPWDDFASRDASGVGAPYTHHCPQSGEVVCTHGPWKVIWRTGPPPEMASQCDLMHLDVWYDDAEVVRDGGSYRYHDPCWHQWYTGHISHNVAYLDTTEPLKRLGCFRWVGDPGVRVTIDASRTRITATHKGWRGAGVDAYHRTLHLLRDAQGRPYVRIEDVFALATTHTLGLHWRLGDGSWSCAQRPQGHVWEVTPHPPSPPVALHLRCTSRPEPPRASRPRLHRGQRGEEDKDGWVSRRYSVHRPSDAMRWEVEGRQDTVLSFITEFRTCGSRSSISTT